MPVYNYTCLKCGATFTVRLHYAEVDDARPICPQCEAHTCERRISSVNVTAGAEAPFTLTREHVEAAAGMANLAQGHGGHHHHAGGCGCGGNCTCSH
ncbi:MAG: zinc ribbon domain-containing protein [Anaerolineae bacterium]|nr:zinc ribbon domain-containing protein [Anaerolineae bacterium]